MVRALGTAGARRRRSQFVALAVTGLAALGWAVPSAHAAVATVPLATAGAYSVLGGATVTNTGGTVLDASLGVSPGTAVVGFPPGRVDAPGTIQVANAAAAQAQSDLTLAYDDAAGRPVSATTAADLTGLTLEGGVYAGPSKGALLLTGSLVLDGKGDPSSVFIFQTNASLTTATGSTISTINGAQPCNVFWQVGSSATLGTSSVFVGSILALTSITVNTGATVHGRALARNGQVSLDTDVFTNPRCAAAGTTTTTATGATSTTAPGGTSSTTASGGGSPSTTAPGTVLVPDGSTTTTAPGTVLVGGPAGSGGAGGTEGPARRTGRGTGADRSRGGTTSDRSGRGPSSPIPDTGTDAERLLLLGVLAAGSGAAALGLRMALVPGRRPG